MFYAKQHFWLCASDELPKYRLSDILWNPKHSDKRKSDMSPIFFLAIFEKWQPAPFTNIF